MSVVEKQSRNVVFNAVLAFSQYNKDGRCGNSCRSLLETGCYALLSSYIPEWPDTRG